MEAKDTLTFLEGETFATLAGFDPDVGKLVKGLLEAQAEISFKAGYQQGVEDFVECAKYIDKGRREVVEYLHKIIDEGRIVWREDEEWQSKLKEWGL